MTLSDPGMVKAANDKHIGTGTGTRTTTTGAMSAMHQRGAVVKGTAITSGPGVMGSGAAHARMNGDTRWMRSAGTCAADIGLTTFRSPDTAGSTTEWTAA